MTKKVRTVLSLEQALSMPYATMRFMQLGWRVIRIESTPIPGTQLPGDPNRYIGENVVDSDRRSYFIAPNVGKESISLNLKSHEGREILKQIIKELEVDIFCCNTLPGRYKDLGIDAQTLRAVKDDLIWVGISAMGPDYPMNPGYDPAIQAMAGYMELTGNLNGDPMLSGIPLIDLKAGDEVYASVCLALAEKAESKKGKTIHVSMLQAASSWLITTLPLLDFNCHPLEITRCGNEHRKFIPVNAYPTRDGHIFIAIGNDVQWERLTKLEKFKSLENEVRKTNQGRHQERESIHQEMADVTRDYTTEELMQDFQQNKIPFAPIQNIEQVRNMPAVRDKLTKTTTPAGKTIHLPPLAVDEPTAKLEYSFAPSYNQHTDTILKEVGFTNSQIDEFKLIGSIPKS